MKVEIENATEVVSGKIIKDNYVGIVVKEKWKRSKRPPYPSGGIHRSRKRLGHRKVLHGEC